MIFCRIVLSSVRSLVLCVLSGVRLLTSATVTSWTLSLPRSSTRRVWPGLSRTAPSSLPSTTAWSGWLNWWGQTLFLLPVTHQPFMFPLLWSSGSVSKHRQHRPVLTLCPLGSLFRGAERVSGMADCGTGGEAEESSGLHLLLRHHLRRGVVWLQPGCGGGKTAQGEGRVCLLHASLCVPHSWAFS